MTSRSSMAPPCSFEAASSESRTSWPGLRRRLGFPGVSVAHAATGRLVDLCELSPRLLDYDECSVTTAGRIGEHFDIAATGASPHFSIILPNADLPTIRALRDLFEVGLPLPPADWPQ